MMDHEWEFAVVTVSARAGYGVDLNLKCILDLLNGLEENSIIDEAAAATAHNKPKLSSSQEQTYKPKKISSSDAEISMTRLVGKT
eukprot:CAMPEP_0194438794 /NCGR_PEP_ID=MMETSP0176-20130528/106919_1 /TAXON_ID=216777 /ORGANISM="Proboscia alata, Strain PI-D3" /LENGTH=84 /DNA_ID=CAMNT_0039261319 /DNA_START=57 /DNA_END=307 /DNA_ORIENTATION=+